MSFPPGVPPPTTKTSSSAAGSTSVDYKLGEGIHTLYTASIHTTEAYQQPAKISMVWLDGSGTEYEHTLSSGYVSANHPFSILSPRILEGPGYIRSTVVHLETTTHDFKVNYIKESSRL